MSHRVLITGASGYLGGTVLARLSSVNLPAYDKLYALVRTEVQADAVKQYGAESLTFDLKDEAAVHDAVVTNKITIVFFLVDAFKAISQGYFIKGLAEVKRNSGLEVHFLHTTGAKLFSSHAGAPTDRPLLDDETDLYEIQKAQKASIRAIQPAVETNTIVIEQSLKMGVHPYIFVPCIVYGKGEGFGNPISIQTVAIIRAARAARRVYSVDSGRPTWPICHVTDTASLYISILHAILSNKTPPSGKEGFYLAAAGSVAWLDLYSAFARSLSQRGLIDTAEVTPATTDEALSQMAKGIGCPKEMVHLQLGGLCTFEARNGAKIGWKPKYGPKHILEVSDEEVELILANL